MGNYRNGGNRRSRNGYRPKNKRRSNSQQSGKVSRDVYTGSSNTANNNPDKEVYLARKFAEFKFHQKLQQNIDKAGFREATEIQDRTIPMIIKGNNVLGFSRTGSGKTGAFLIPVINKMLAGNNSERVLIVAPTRELAMQISKEAVKFVRGTPINVSLILGGESFGRQISQLRRGDEFIVGTPGRIKDMMNKGHIRAERINNIIVDEVDRMLDMGFVEDIRGFFKIIAADKQSLFFSATYNKSVINTVTSMISDFEVVKITDNSANQNIIQNVVDYKQREEKISLLQELLNKDEVKKAIIFVQTKRYADKVYKSLSGSNYRVNVIHGGKNQNQRRRVYNSFKDSRIDYLVATNVAARGLDIDDITHIINFDEPDSHEEYVHRVGRTGRNGKTGTAYTFVKR